MKCRIYFEEHTSYTVELELPVNGSAQLANYIDDYGEGGWFEDLNAQFPRWYEKPETVARSLVSAITVEAPPEKRTKPTAFALVPTGTPMGWRTAEGRILVTCYKRSCWGVVDLKHLHSQMFTSRKEAVKQARRWYESARG